MHAVNLMWNRDAVIPAGMIAGEDEPSLFVISLVLASTTNQMRVFSEVLRCG
jgi:hypothetical protein